MWQGIEGHDEIAERFRQTIASGRLASTYLFVGPSGIGKKMFAVELARSLLCLASDEASLDPCGQCESCRLFAAGNHPDFELVGLPPDKATLPIALFIGDDEQRNQTGLCHNLSLKPFFGKRKIAVVDDADHFSVTSANCLLKTLEEPPPNALLIMIGTSPSRQLPTIRSRSQIVRFAPLEPSIVSEILMRNGAISDSIRAERAAELGRGSVERALLMADEALSDFRRLLITQLTAPVVKSVRLGRVLQAFVDEAGKEASLRRDRLRQVIGFAIDHFRLIFHSSTGESVDAAIRAIDASLAALEHIDRNANLGIVIQNWCEELASAMAGKPRSGGPIGV